MYPQLPRFFKISFYIIKHVVLIYRIIYFKKTATSGETVVAKDLAHTNTIYENDNTAYENDNVHVNEGIIFVLII